MSELHHAAVGGSVPAEGAGVAPGSDVPRFHVLGVAVSAVDVPSAVSTIGAWIGARVPRYVCVSGVHGVMESHDDDSLRDIHNRAGLVTPDGMPLVWLGWLAGHRRMSRVYGPDLMLACCAESERAGWKHFLYGGGDGVAELLAARLTERFPRLQIVGTYTPPFRPLTPAEEEDVTRRIIDARADVVWVGLSTPKQERWMAAHVGRVGAPVLLGVGAAFDFHAGLKRQAPRWIQRSGTEWLYRLMTEPRRLWKRYLRNNPRFVWHVALQQLGLGPYGLRT